MNNLEIIAEAGKAELYIKREFDAPRELVFEAFHDASLLAQWLGPDGMTMEIDYFDSRSGGSYRFIHIDEKGNRYGFNGVIHEVAPPERLIRTFEFEGLPERGHVSIEFLTLQSLPGDRTQLTIQSVFRSVADRDGLVHSGMERGVSQGFQKLDQLLATRN